MLPEGYTMMRGMARRGRGVYGVSAGVLSSVHVQAGASLTPGEGGKAHVAENSYIPASIRKFKKGYLWLQ